MSLQASPSAADRLPRVGAVQAGVVSVGSLGLIILGLVIQLTTSGSLELEYGPLSFVLVLAGVPGLFVGALLVLYSYIQTKRLARVIASDKLLAHWTIGGERWQAYITRERARATRQMVICSVVALVFIVVLEVLLPLFRGIEAVSKLSNWRQGLAIGACLIGVNMLFWAVNQRRLYMLSRRTANAIYITIDGVVLGQQWHTWRKFGSGLQNVAYESNPNEELIFTYRKQTASPLPSYVQLYVPVPDNRVQDASRLVARLKQA